MYEGGYCNDERWGKGISYDLNGNVDHKGEWMNNHVMTEKGNDLIVPVSIKEYTIGDRIYYHYATLILHFAPLLVRLKRIGIGNECFKHVREFVIDGLPNLERVNS